MTYWAIATRDLAKRAWRLALTLSDPADQNRLQKYAEELDQQASRLKAETSQQATSLSNNDQRQLPWSLTSLRPGGRAFIRKTAEQLGQ